MGKITACEIDEVTKLNSHRMLACSRRSDSGARAKNKASERASLPSFFPALSLAFFFARALLSERLEQANRMSAPAISAGCIYIPSLFLQLNLLVQEELSARWLLYFSGNLTFAIFSYGS